MKTTTWLIIGGAVLAVVVISVAAGGFSSGIPVEVTEVSPGSIEGFVDERGKTRLPETYLITMPFAGRIEPISLIEGDEVRQGQVVDGLDFGQPKRLRHRPDLLGVDLPYPEAIPMLVGEVKGEIATVDELPLQIAIPSLADLFGLAYLLGVALPAHLQLVRLARYHLNVCAVLPSVGDGDRVLCCDGTILVPG